MYYACFRIKKDQKDKNEPQKIIKKAFNTRDEARDFLNIHMDFDKYDQCWTE